MLDGLDFIDLVCELGQSILGSFFGILRAQASFWISCRMPGEGPEQVESLIPGSGVSLPERVNRGKALRHKPLVRFLPMDAAQSTSTTANGHRCSVTLTAASIGRNLKQNVELRGVSVVASIKESNCRWHGVLLDPNKNSSSERCYDG